MKKIIDFLKDEEGATMPEYALMLALIAIVSIAVITVLGTNVRDKFGEARDALE